MEILEEMFNFQTLTIALLLNILLGVWKIMRR